MRRHPRRASVPAWRPAAAARPVAPRPDERRELLRRLEAAEARYEALAGMLPLVSYVAPFDVYGAFLSISPQVEALLGFPPARWVADPRLWLSRLHPGDRVRVLSRLARKHRGPEPLAEEYRLLDRQGRPRWVRDESRVVRDAEGRALFITGTWTEISGHKRRERDAAARERRLESARSELELFVSVASHELTAPLRRIVNLGELLEKRASRSLDEESRGLLRRMRASGARLQELVLALVRYAEQDGGAPARERTELDRVLDEALQELAEPARSAGAVVTRGPLPVVWSEPALLARVLHSLLDNALKHHGARPPRVHVWAERAGPDWVVSVRDEGPGLDVRQARRAFSLFERAEHMTPGSGMGLGLAVSRKFVERLGGRIWVESEPGEGATFRFTLPAAGGEDEP